MDLDTGRHELPTFLPNDWERPIPSIEQVSETRNGDLVQLEITAVNRSPYPSPRGGITLSFPEKVRPADAHNIIRVEGQDGMTANIIPAGEPLFTRTGEVVPASNLMLEIEGHWAANQQRTLQVTMAYNGSPVLVQYRSALADHDGRYLNAPRDSQHLDQQGWPVEVCVANSYASQGNTDAGVQ